MKKTLLFFPVLVLSGCVSLEPTYRCTDQNGCSAEDLALCKQSMRDSNIRLTAKSVRKISHRKDDMEDKNFSPDPSRLRGCRGKFDVY